MNKKKTSLMVAAMLAVSAITFSGCSAGTAADNSASVSESAQGSQKANADVKLSDARNTPAVRAAKMVGPAVVKEIIVSLSDGRSLKGKLIGADELTDLAVVKVDGKDLPTAKFGDSDQIVVGEPAIAIGNPMGLEFRGSVTSGVVSAVNRTLDISDKLVKLIQTDAAINPGNSGGALVNADGEVIGINSAKLAASGVEGMGFAIPTNTVQNIIDEIMNKGYVARPYLGVSVFDPQTAGRYGYQLNIDKGVYIFQLTLNGPCGKAGLQRGDIILKVNDEEVNSVADLRAKVAAHKVGDTVKVTFDRNGASRNVDVVLEEMPQDNR